MNPDPELAAQRLRVALVDEFVYCRSLETATKFLEIVELQEHLRAALLAEPDRERLYRELTNVMGEIDLVFNEALFGTVWGAFDRAREQSMSGGDPCDADGDEFALTPEDLAYLETGMSVA